MALLVNNAMSKDSFLSDEILTNAQLMAKSTESNNITYRINQWRFNHSLNRLSLIAGNESKRIEPKVSELLYLLIMADGEVVSKATLTQKLWRDTVVSEDTLARTISRLRSELNDSAANPKYIETISKKGYRLIPDVEIESPTKSKTFITTAVALVMLIAATLLWSLNKSDDDAQITEMISRADTLYMKFEEQSNEAAIVLYQKALELDADNPLAQAGIANALVQRLIRWPSAPYTVEQSGISLTNALASGQLETADAKLMLERARLIAERAVRQNPRDIQALKSLGFTYSAEGKIAQAIEYYSKAIAIDEYAWRSLINLGELYKLNGQTAMSLETFIQAYEAMQAKFQEEPQHIGPWQHELGYIIASTYAEAGDESNAQLWANKVLELVPFERKTYELLIRSLKRTGLEQQVTELCGSYSKKLDQLLVCND